MPIVDEPALVPTPNGNGNRDSNHTSPRAASAIIGGGSPTPPGGRRLDITNRLEIIRGDLASKGISSSVVELLLAGARPTTQIAYQSAWSAWCSWCAERRSNPVSATINDVLEFLGYLFSLGRAYNTINVARSMLSGTLPPLEGQPIGQHYLVLKLMKGIYNSKPPKPRYSATWSLDLLINHLNSLAPNSELNLPLLSRKLAILLAVTSMLRISELVAIDRQSVNITENEASFALLKPRKAQKEGALHNISIKGFTDSPKLCPVNCLGHYIFQTDPLRNRYNGRNLFIATIRPYKGITGSSLGRWIKAMLAEAGVNTSSFTAHSTRSASASKAARSGVPIDTILKTAHWSNESTFSKFYRRDVESQNITETILNPEEENLDE